MREKHELDWLNTFVSDHGKRHVDFVMLPGSGARPLHHYTTLDGLGGIVRSRDLWLTNALYSNDEKEITLGRELVSEELRAQQRRRGVAKRYREYVKALEQLLPSASTSGVYICCFCQDGDRLGQWRAYGGNGNGVSLQFRAEDFASFTGPSAFGHLSLWKVSYDQAWQRTLLRDAVLNTYDRHRTLPVEKIARAAKTVIDFFVPTFKGNGFQEEEEWRMVFAPAAESGPQAVPLDYRVSGNMLVPYYRLSRIVEKTSGSTTSWQLPVSRVVIGPSRHKNLNRASAAMLLASSGFNDPIEVQVSQTPYRG